MQPVHTCNPPTSLVDTLGLLLSVAVHAANIQDRDGVAYLRRWRLSGTEGAAAKTGCWTIEIVGRSPTAVGFEVLPKRWIVERTFARAAESCRASADDRCPKSCLSLGTVPG
jgi:transposase